MASLRPSQGERVPNQLGSCRSDHEEEALGRAGEIRPRPKRFLVTLPIAAIMTAAIMSTAVVAIGAAGASSALGTPHPATLPAVTIGLISDAGGSAGVATGSLVEQGAKAAVAYDNEYQDGLEGHKIAL